MALEPAVGQQGSAFHRAPTPAASCAADQPRTALERWTQEAEDDAAAARAGSPCAQLDDLNRLLDSMKVFEDATWHSLAGRQAHEALDVVEQLDRRLTGLRSQILAAIDGDKLWALDGQRTFAAWVRERTGTTQPAASRQVRTSRALRDHLPLTHAALMAGQISEEHLAVLVRVAITTDRLRAQLTDSHLGEAFLVEQAREMDAGTFTTLVKTWAIAADPEAADRAWRDAEAKEEFTLSRTMDGFHIAGWLNEVSGQAVEEAIRSHMGRKGKDDERSPAQRRAAALVALARQSLDSGTQQPHARIRPHLTVTTSWETFKALVSACGSAVPPLRSDGEPYPPGSAFGITADKTLSSLGGPRHPGTDPDDLFSLSDEAREWLRQWQPGDDHVIPAAIDHQAMTGVEPATLPDGTPIAPALLARLACDSGLSRVMFGPASTVLDVGREQRIFPAHMVKAIIARDRSCRYPGCDEPPGFGEIHHALQWYRDNGPTAVDLGILLCWHHHDWVHANAITIVRADGRWYFYNRHGWLITGASPSATAAHDGGASGVLSRPVLEA